MDRSIEPPRRVLLADDDQEICKSWAEVLESEDWVVERCFDGEAVQGHLFNGGDCAPPLVEYPGVCIELECPRSWRKQALQTGP